jgi:hypothetical protein
VEALLFWLTSPKYIFPDAGNVVPFKRRKTEYCILDGNDSLEKNLDRVLAVLIVIFCVPAVINIFVEFVVSILQSPNPRAPVTPVGPIGPVLPVGPVAPSPCANVTLANGPTGQQIFVPLLTDPSTKVPRPRGAIFIEGAVTTEVQYTIPLIAYWN